MATSPSHPQISVAILCSPLDKSRLPLVLSSVEWAGEVLVDQNELPIDDFSQVRNRLLQKAKNDWVFFIDADEVLSSTSEEVERAIRRAEEQDCAAIELRRQDVFLGQKLRWGELHNYYCCRLLRKDRACFVRPIHEQARCKEPVMRSDLLLTHNSHQSISHFLQKITRYADLESQHRILKGDPFRKMDLVMYPLGKFIWNYLFKLGFIDGWRGLVYALVMSVHSLSVRVFWYERL